MKWMDADYVDADGDTAEKYKTPDDIGKWIQDEEEDWLLIVIDENGELRYQKMVKNREKKLKKIKNKLKQKKRKSRK